MPCSSKRLQKYKIFLLSRFRLEAKMCKRFLINPFVFLQWCKCLDKGFTQFSINCLKRQKRKWNLFEVNYDSAIKDDKMAIEIKNQNANICKFVPLQAAGNSFVRGVLWGVVLTWADLRSKEKKTWINNFQDHNHNKLQSAMKNLSRWDKYFSSIAGCSFFWGFWGHFFFKHRRLANLCSM